MLNNHPEMFYDCEYNLDINLCYFVLREWMEGAWGTVDPDKVDGETGNFWRALYKLEKQFSDIPNAQKIASRVRYTVNTFSALSILFFS